MFLVDEKPALDAESLAHFGVKGMKWGHKKSNSSDSSSSSNSSDKPKMSTKKKVAIGVTVGAGAAAVAYLLSNRGRTSVRGVIDRIRTNRANAASLRRAESASQSKYMKSVRDNNPFAQQVGQYAKYNRGGNGHIYDQGDREVFLDRIMKTPAKDISQSEWRNRVSSVRKDIAGANREQDSYMRSLGLGAAINRAG